MTSSSPPSTLPTPEAAPPASGVAVRTEPPGWLAWTALGIVYVIWGSTYLAIRVMVETVPPLLGAGLRFTVAGGVLVLVLAVRHGASVLWPGRRELLGALLIGVLLPGANAVVSVAEQHVPSGLTALLIASVPLWVIVLRRLAGERVHPATLGAVLLGFAGLALLLNPGESAGEATIGGLLTVIAAAIMWASGSFASRRVPLPRLPLASTGWQMLLGGLVTTAAGLIAGEAGDVHFSEFSARSIVAFAYLVVFGSWVAFTAYAWLLQNVALSKVSTYAYVNPVVAIFLGWLILDETVTGLTFAAAAIIVVSVALVVRSEARPAR